MKLADTQSESWNIKHFRFLMDFESGIRPHKDAMKSHQAIEMAGDHILLEDSNKGTLSITCNGHGLRRDFLPAQAHGFCESIKLGDNLILNLNVITPVKPIPYNVVYDDSIYFGIQLHAIQEITPTINTRGDNVLFLGALTNQSAGSEQLLAAEETFKSVYFSTSSEDNTQISEVRTPNLSRLLVDCLEETSELDACFTLDKAKTSVRKCANEILFCDYEGQLRYDYLQAKAKEMLCHIEHQSTLFAAKKTKPSYRMSQADREALQKVRININKSPGEDLRITSLARDIDFSANKLISLFRTHYDESIHQYVTRIRMERAQKLLRESDLTVKDIAVKTGYKDVSGFGRAFKKYFGIGPTKYRIS